MSHSTSTPDEISAFLGQLSEQAEIGHFIDNLGHPNPIGCLACRLGWGWPPAGGRPGLIRRRSETEAPEPHTTTMNSRAVRTVSLTRLTH